MLYRSGKLAAMAVLLLGVASCAPAPSGPPRVVVEGDAFSKDVTILGVQILDNQLLKPYDKAHWYLRSFVSPQTHTATHQFYAELIYADGRNGAYSASDNHAQSHRVDLLYHQGCGPHGRNEVCGYEDTIGIDIPEATLRANAAQGLDIKVTARSGYARIMAITPEMIDAQLYATQEILSGKVVVGQTVKSGGTIAAGPPVVVPANTSPSADPAPINARRPDGKPLLGIAPFDLLFGVGVQVNRVDPNTPAEVAGFQIGDLVLSYNGQKVTSAGQLSGLIEQTAPGTLVPIEINRHEKRMTLTAQM